MALPREPRQKMINMMYLVLTALLALNVSSEILNAFKTVNNSLQNTNTTIGQSTEGLMTSLKQKMSEAATAEKAKVWYPKADAVRNYAKGLFEYIQTVKDDILTKAGGDPKNDEKSYKEDNLDIATRMMVDKGGGQELLKKLGEFKNNVLAIDPEINSTFKETLPIDLTIPKHSNKSNKTWEAVYFHMVPTVAALTILSKFQNDVKTSENRLIQFCHAKVGEVAYRSNAYAAIAVADANYVMPGNVINITAGVGGFSTAGKPEISINGSPVAVGTDGTATSKITAGGLGQHSVTVHFIYTDQDGKRVPIDKTIEYTVGQSTASIGLPQMNVLYVGIDNEVVIAASGAGDDKVSVSLKGGTITKQGGGKYIARVNNPTEDAVVNVSVDGKPAASQSFRVRLIPRPVGTVGGFESGDNVNAGAFRAQAGVGAYIKDFPLNLKYTVTSFTLTADVGDDILEAPCTGNLWSPRALQIIKGLTGGKTVTVDEIRAVGPDGRTQKLPSLVYYIK